MKTGDQYSWTKHSQYKMRYYGLSPQRIKRIIRHPARMEEAIIPKMIAAMQPAGGKNYSEIWAIYQLAKHDDTKYKIQNTKYNQIKVITAWRYPGKSPARDPIPQDILNEIKSLI